MDESAWKDSWDSCFRKLIRWAGAQAITCYLALLLKLLAHACFGCLLSYICQNRNKDNKRKIFEVPHSSCLFLTRSPMLLWTHLFHPEVNSESLKSVWPTTLGWRISGWKITTLAFPLGGFLLSSTNSHKSFQSLLNPCLLELKMSVALALE